MRLQPFFVPLLVLAGAVACASPSEETARAEADQTGVAPVRGVLVLADQRFVSEHLAPDGSVESSSLQFDIQTGSKILRAAREHASPERVTCTIDLGGQTHTQEGTYVGSSLRLVDTASGQEVSTLVPLNPRATESNVALTDEQRIEITGNVGRYVFVRTRHDWFGCGAAHPSWDVTAFVWDLWTSQRVSLDVPPTAAARAREMLAGKGSATADVEIAELTPAFERDGTLTVDYRFEKSASHAEADGIGRDYSVSAVVHSRDLAGSLPKELAPLRTPPTVVQKYLRAHPVGETSQIRGWSISEDNQTVHGPMCASQTLGGEYVPIGTCVQDSDDDGARWYVCEASANETWADADPSKTMCSSVIALCTSRTLGRKVTRGTCVQDSDDGSYYRCNGDGATDWVKPAVNSCWTTISLCDSGTLGRKVAQGTCVQDSQGTHPWYRCDGRGHDDWSALPSGPDVSCREKFAFAE